MTADTATQARSAILPNPGGVVVVVVVGVGFMAAFMAAR